MAKGESTWSSRGKEVKKTGFEPLPPGWYEAKLDASAAEIRRADGEGKFSRLSVRFRVPRDSGRDAIVFHDFYLRTQPNEKGTVLVQMSGQLVQFAHGLGEEVEGITLVSENGEKILNPIEVKKWLQNRDGEVVNLRVKVEKDQQQEPRNRISEFEEKEIVNSDEDEETEEVEEAEEGDEDAFSKVVSAKRGRR